MDPGPLDESVSLKEATDWMEKYHRFLATFCSQGYDYHQFSYNLWSRLDQQWRSHVGKLERYKTIPEIMEQWKKVLEILYPLHIRRIAFYST